MELKVLDANGKLKTSGGGGGGGDALTTDPLSQFAATTSLQLKGVISDETGSGALVFATSPTLVTPILGTPTSGTLTNCTGLPVAGGGTGASTAAGARVSLFPAMAGEALKVVRVNAGETDLEYATVSGTGDVTAAATITDHSVVRGDGGAKGVQDSGVIIDDTDNVTGMATLTLPNTGLHVLDTNASHDLIIAPGSDLTADHTLSIVTGDADRTLTLSGNATLAGGTHSGTNTGDQTITLSGDVTGTGTGSFAATIANDAVTYAKMQNVSATDKVLGRSTAGAGDVEEIACTAAGRALIDDADATAQRATLGLVIGTNVQAYDAELAAIAGLTSAADKGIQFTGSGTAATYDLTAAGKALLDDADASAQRTTLGVGTIGTLSTLQAGFTVMIDGGGSAITTGVKHYIEMPVAMTITGWTLVADASGSIVIDVWKDTYANFPPTVADTIAGSEKPTLSSAQKNQDTTLSTWTTSVAQGDILGFNVDSATTVTKVWLTIRGTRAA